MKTLQTNKRTASHQPAPAAVLNPETKIDELLKRYPFLMDFFLRQSPQFKLLKNPLARRTFGKVATLAQAAVIGRLDLDQLLSDTANEIRTKTGEAVTIGNQAKAAETAPAQDRQARQELLKGIIRDLHQGVEMDELKQRFHSLVKDVDPAEIARMEQGLIEEGMPESEIKRLCDVHVEVFKESLGKRDTVQAPPGHPVHTFMLENRTAERIIAEMSRILDELRDAETADFDSYRDDLRDLVARLSEIDLHYQRKEHQLFPRLEAHDIGGPSEVMWAIHDDIRGTVKTAQAQLEAAQGEAALATIRELTQAVVDMIYKEENILFPMTMETLSEADWQQVRHGEEEIGYAWIVPTEKWVSTETPIAAHEAGAGPAMLDLDTGYLTPEQVNLIFTHQPVEVSFVDEKDEVRYYSQVKHKIFPRSPGAIGRRVQNCHPPASMDKVQRILDEFRAGTRDAADFWIEMGGRCIYIRYFAVRDSGGVYKGTLEVVQDVTEIRKLTGEKRLIDWEPAVKADDAVIQP